MGSPTDVRHARSLMSLPTKATSVSEIPISCARLSRVLRLSSQFWKHRIFNLAARADTTGLDSVDIMTVSIPNSFSFCKPIPSLRQQRTASDPSSKTYTMLSVKTPSKSNAIRRILKMRSFNFESTIRHIETMSLQSISISGISSYLRFSTERVIILFPDLVRSLNRQPSAPPRRSPVDRPDPQPLTPPADAIWPKS